MLAREVKILFRKELGQLLRNKGAMLTALFLPLLLMLIIPLAQVLAVNPDHPKELPIPPDVSLPPGLAEVGKDPLATVRLLLTPLISMGGLLTPALTASYIFISERESRTLELLVALPVRVGQILQAKLLAILALSAPVCLGLFAIVGGLMLSRGLGSPGYVVAMFIMVAASLAFSSSTALFVSLLARDIRTASNLNGLVLSPFLLGSFIVMAVVPGTTLASAVIAGGYLLGTAVVLLLALRVVTFERMLR
ncbi:ABC transporter permease [Hyalangium sp.]|uniref:ABC transporter permease n=1 Tax=Hyalangium sp. TaxID=2028555 RepID=UPI002D360B57|nr:ABC transporter permease [Hyalangium sp.]HYI02029.1 ABC transporter permease [Hyalangium sp.]